MSMRELDRLKCIQGLIDGQLKQTAVAARLGLTTRQVRRLVRRYEQQGPIGLISRLRDRPSNRRLKSDAAEHAFGILRSTYADFGPTLAAEEAQRAPRRGSGGRDRQISHGRRRPMGAAKTSGAEDSTTPEPPRVPRRARRVAAKFGCPLDSEPADTITTLISGEHPASAHLAPVCHMHYDAACPQWNGSIAVASRCTSKTTRLRTFTSSRQVTNVYLWLSNRSKYWRARPIHAM